MTHMPGYPCATCRRASAGYSLTAPQRQVVSFCSDDCMRVYAMGITTLKQDETKAVLAAGNKAGAYLDQIGKFDLRTLTAQEWEAFCGMIFAETCAALKAQADGEIPF